MKSLRLHQDLEKMIEVWRPKVWFKKQFAN